MERLSNLNLTINPISQNDLFQHVEMAPPDPIIGTREAYNKNPNPQKINLGIGAYRDSEGKPYVFKVVEKVEHELISKKMNHVTESSSRNTSISRATRSSSAELGTSSSELIVRQSRSIESPACRCSRALAEFIWP